MTDTSRANRIAALNDQVRRRVGMPAFDICQTNPHRVLMTAGVRALPPEDQLAIWAAVRDFRAFDTGNDPHGEHDFGSLSHDGHTIFFKIEYYDLALEAGSGDPADPSRTCRVLTLMLAEEY